MKRHITRLFIALLVCSLLMGSFSSYAAEWSYSDDPSYWGSNYKTWSQGAAEYGSYLNKYGCFVVAMSKLLMEVNAVPEVFNPGVFLKWEKENGYIDNGFYQTGKGGSGYAPVAYAKLHGVTLSVDVYPGSMTEANMIKLLKEGKYLIVQVLSKPDHYVYVARDESINAGKIYYWDSWTSLNNSDKRHKTVNYMQSYSSNGYKVYCVWAYSVKGTEQKQPTPATDQPYITPSNPPANTPQAQAGSPDPVTTPVTEGWIPASSLPEGAKVTATKWIYDLTQYFETTDPNLSGWTQIGSEWRQSGSGSVEYAIFPEGFDKNHSIYKTYNNTPYTAYDNGSTKREVSNTRFSYIYWHWTYEPGLPGSSVYNRYIQDHAGYDSETGFTFDDFHAFTDPIDHEYYSNLGVYKYNAGQYWSWWWFRIDLMRSTYTDYTKYYKYTRTVKTESYTYPSGSGISNIQEWVRCELPYSFEVPTPGTGYEPINKDMTDYLAPKIVLTSEYVKSCAYNAYGNNYFKLRDIAYMLSGTTAQFDVEYDSSTKSISLIGGKEYKPVGDELMGKSAQIRRRRGAFRSAERM